MKEKYKTTSLIISHDMNCVRLTSDSIVMLIEGSCYKQGSYETLSHHADKKVLQFFE
jgi:phospholipid/cholesterol/gamma-HCH transport system ATP-binding protein